MPKANYLKKTFNWSYNFRGLEPMIVEEILTGKAENVYFKLQTGGRNHTGKGANILKSQDPPTMTHLLQKGHAP